MLKLSILPIFNGWEGNNHYKHKSPPSLRFETVSRIGRVQIHMRAFDHDAQARGKTMLQALVATIRHAIYSMFKHGQLSRIAGSSCCNSRLIHTARLFRKWIASEGKGAGARTPAHVTKFAHAALPLQAGCIAQGNKQR